MQLVVFEDAACRNLLPLTWPRATFNLRCGCDSLLAKIETAIGRTADAIVVRPQLADVMDERQRTQHAKPRPVNAAPDGDDQLWLNGRLLVTAAFEIPRGSAAWAGDALLAARIDRATAAALSAEVMLAPPRLKKALAKCAAASLPAALATLIDWPWQLVHANEAEIVRQVGAMNRQRIGRVDAGAHLLNEADIHIAADARVMPGAVLDAESGPIHIGEGTIIGPHTTITGPCTIAEQCVIRPGASISGSSIGPVCKVGGEIEASIIHALANKQHDGFLGHSYVGEWVNLGADTVTSDLKNTYGPVTVPINGRPVNSGETFVGAFIGDHTKTGINVALPTGCVIGHACNIFVSRQAPKFVPSFSWLTDDGAEPNDPARAAAVAEKVMARRGRTFTAAERDLFLAIAEADGAPPQG